MAFFIVYEDGEKDNPEHIEAENMNVALDWYAKNGGYIDYADMAQERGWKEDEGLNVEVDVEMEKSFGTLR